MSITTHSSAMGEREKALVEILNKIVSKYYIFQTQFLKNI